MANVVRTAALAWIIIVGGLMITPDGIFCIACNPGLIKVLGAISVVLGAAALAVSRQDLTANNQ